jgi:hypothetical protein
MFDLAQRSKDEMMTLTFADGLVGGEPFHRWN